MKKTFKIYPLPPFEEDFYCIFQLFRLFYFSDFSCSSYARAYWSQTPRSDYFPWQYIKVATRDVIAVRRLYWSMPSYATDTNIDLWNAKRPKKYPQALQCVRNAKWKSILKGKSTFHYGTSGAYPGIRTLIRIMCVHTRSEKVNMYNV